MNNLDKAILTIKDLVSNDFKEETPEIIANGSNKMQ